MKEIKFLTGFAMFLMIFSCAEKENAVIEINKVEDHVTETSETLKVKVDNELDPICDMVTAEYLSDTLHYKGQVIGFCSKGCKETFAENPGKYFSKIEE
jgi:YHS domain-containing protein